MATTMDALLDRARAVCAAAPFLWRESVSFLDFTRQPAGAADGVYRVMTTGPVRVESGMGMVEERTETLLIEWTETIGDDYDQARRRVTQAATSLTSALIRDGSDSGHYAVPDAGRSAQVFGDRQQAYLIGRLTLPVNYEAVL